MSKREVQVDPEERLPDCPEKPSAISWPMPVDRRLDELVAAARDLGERTTRKEMAAAIVLAFDDLGDGLCDTLRRYRLARARDAVMASPSTDNVLLLPRHPPGPRVTKR